MRKHFHISKIHSGWSFGFGISRESGLDETYIWINFFKWMFCFGKLAYLKSFDLEEENE